MSYKFLLIISMVLCTQVARSQPFSGGFFAGFTTSQVQGDNYGGFDKFGITAGGYIFREHLRNTGWKAEIRYIQKGSAKRPTESDPTYYKLTIHYIEFPLLYQYYINRSLTIDAGLTPDVYLAHREEDEDGLMSQEDRPPYHRLGLNGDIGIYYRLGDHIIVGARGSHSIIAAREHAGGLTYLLNRGQYNKVIHFSVYYQFE